MEKILDNSAVTENSHELELKSELTSVYVFDVVDEGSWTGSIKILGRVRGRNTGAMLPLALINDTTLATIDGSTGATAAGVYSCDVKGREFVVSHTRATGAVSVYGRIHEG